MLNINNLYLQLGEFQLKNIHLDIKDEEYFVLLGPSGAGKTVMLEIIAGLYKKTKGQVLFNSSDLLKLPPEEREIGFVYQRYELFPHMTVKDNIIFGMRIKKINKKIIERELSKLVHLLGIEHLLKRYPVNLSGGEQQRVALARALIISPKILLLDEPLSALDQLNKESLKKELKKIHKNFKTTIIHVTHDLDEALFLADKIGIMLNGELLQVKEKDEFLEKPKSYLLDKFVI
ncbi:ATP-binding cassette domain-containing protein [Clostridium sediminicola]|uniref:ATP-binding cassette domain-containing protein n=1 Tax=Clostridium sediminicola TaxID=3114879 RepID=UPI0031F21CE7